MIQNWLYISRSSRFDRRKPHGAQWLNGSFHAAFRNPPSHAVREMASKWAVNVAKRPRPCANTPMPMVSSRGYMRPTQRNLGGEMPEICHTFVYIIYLYCLMPPLSAGTGSGSLSSEGPIFSWKHWTSWASQNKGAWDASCHAGTAKDKQTRSWRRRQDILRHEVGYHTPQKIEMNPELIPSPIIWIPFI